MAKGPGHCAGGAVPSDRFYREEWEKVVKPQEIRIVGEYMEAKRIGRGVPLNRRGRVQVWSVFEEHRVLFNEHNLRSRPLPHKKP